MKDKLSWLGLAIPGVILTGVVGASALVLEPKLEEIPQKMELVIEQTPKVEVTNAPVEKAIVVKNEKKKDKKIEKVLYKASENGYKDGIYYGSANGYGGPIKVKVTIKNGKIIAVEIISATGETPSFLTMARPVTNRIVQSQSPNVDGVSGATYTSNGIMNATIVALNQAGNTTFTAKDNSKEKNTSKTEQNTKKTTKNKTKDKKKNNTNKDLENAIFENGTYHGSGEGYGGTIEVKVVIKKNKIHDIEIVSAKYETPEYYDMAKGIVNTIKKKQTPQVDAISGATYTSEGIKEAVRVALNKAIKKEKEQEEKTPVPTATTEPTIAPTVNPDGTTTILEDGSVCVEVTETYEEQYTSTGICYPDDYEEFLEYSIELLLNAKVTHITRTITKDGVETVEEEKHYEITDLSFSQQTIDDATEEGNWFYLKRAAEGFKDKVGVFAQLLENNQTTQVDAVSTATCSSNAIWDAYKAGIEQMK